MIQTIIRLLKQNGFLDGLRQTDDFAVDFTRAHTFGILFRCNAAPYLYAKVSESISSRDEAMRYKTASQLLGDLVPKHLDYIVESNLQIHVTEGLDYKSANAEAFLAGSAGTKSREGLLRYASCCATIDVDYLAGDLSNAELNAALLSFFQGADIFLELLPKIRPLLDRTDLSRYKNISQHGDFALTNICLVGATAKIIDWEDFGRIRLPGLDLYQLLLSMRVQPESIEMPRHLAPLLPQASLVEQFCAALDFPVADFYTLIPIYAMIVCYLRRTYSTASQAHSHSQLKTILGKS